MRIAKGVRGDKIGKTKVFRRILFRFYHLYDKCNRVTQKGLAFEMPEPCALKGAGTVLRGLGDGNIPRLPDPLKYLIKIKTLNYSLSRI